MECQRRIDSTLDDDEQSDAWMDQLSDDARLIWSDANARATALEDIARAWRQGDSDLDPLIQRVDAAVVEGLAALGFPRGQVRAVLVETLGVSFIRRKHTDCRISFSGCTSVLLTVTGAWLGLLGRWVLVPDRFN
jgi:hypothetical protein